MAMEVRKAAREMRFPEARREMTQMASQFERLAHQHHHDDDEALAFDGVLAAWARRQSALA
jgi:hypothetical protein